MKIPKIENAINCDNWKNIILISSKILLRIIFDRTWTAIGHGLRCEIMVFERVVFCVN
jgi:hypothetical protein